MALPKAVLGFAGSPVFFLGVATAVGFWGEGEESELLSESLLLLLLSSKYAVGMAKTKNGTMKWISYKQD